MPDHHVINVIFIVFLFTTQDGLSVSTWVHELNTGQVISCEKQVKKGHITALTESVTWLQNDHGNLQSLSNIDKSGDKDLEVGLELENYKR